VLSKARRDGASKLLALAGQAANHAFFFEGLTPKGGGEAPDALARPIKEEFGSLGDLRTRFGDAATGVMGSGWVWLARRPGGTLAVEVTHDADSLIGGPDIPLLVCDVWEHAYYLDFRHRRAKYVEAFWNLVDWSVVAERAGAGAE
jgi:Fe-Mn family superoxide dismutase